MPISLPATNDGPRGEYFARLRPVLPWLILGLVLAANLALRWPLLDVPFERDEGEFAYGGQRLLAGEPPYRSCYAMKWPGIYAAYAGIELLFGQTTVGVHLGLILVTSINLVWMFLIGRRLLDDWGGVWSAAAFAALCYSRGVQPMTTQSQHFVLACALPGVLLLMHAWRSPRWRVWMLAGILFGMGALMKQHGAFLALTGVVGLAAGLFRDRDRRRSWLVTGIAFGGGLVLPLAITVGLLAWGGTLALFKLWTIDYARAYATNDALDFGIERLMLALSLQMPPIWPLLAAAAAGGVLIVLRRRTNEFGLLIAAWIVGSWLAFIPGWHFRPHYFFLIWPVVAVLAAIGLRWLASSPADTRAASPSQRVRLVVGVVTALMLVVWPVTTSARYLLTKSPWELSRLTYGYNPFNECPQVAEYIKAHSSPDDSIAVLGSQPQIYFLAQRRAATGHMYAYPLLEVQPYAVAMQQSMIEEITTARPKFIVHVHDWLQQPGVPTPILHWIPTYLAANYELRGCVEILSSLESHFAWDENAPRYEPKDFCIIEIYRRKEG
ncbi:MAG: glycosyltransferase family 39 protein [Pirellulales bacterium]|nr:glycosyltransferase family 39 protein [Pirellulales bacterium]